MRTENESNDAGDTKQESTHKVILECGADPKNPNKSKLDPMSLIVARGDKIHFIAKGTKGQLNLTNVKEFLEEKDLETDVPNSDQGGGPKIFRVSKGAPKGQRKEYYFDSSRCPRADSSEAAARAEPTMEVSER